MQNVKKALGLALKGVMGFNLAALVRISRFGLGDGLRKLSRAYDEIRPFAKKQMIRPLVQKYCIGQGLEIGPGTRPYCDPKNTVFLDKYPSPDLTGVKISIVSEAFAIPKPDNTFDFIFSSHCLEHCPDTLRALNEWKRVLKPGGIIYLVLPHGARTFDRGRSLTKLPHHITDHEKGVGYEDFTHWEEFERYTVAQHHHFWLDNPDCRNPDGTLNRQWVIENGAFHYHVWTIPEIVELLKHIGCEILKTDERLEETEGSFLVIGRVKK